MMPPEDLVDSGDGDVRLTLWVTCSKCRIRPNRIYAFRGSSFSRPTRLMPTREGEPVHDSLISLIWRTGGRRPRTRDHVAWLLEDGAVVHGAHVGSQERRPRSSFAIRGALDVGSG